MLLNNGFRKGNVMRTNQIREELHEYINKADERLLKLIYAMVQADLQEDKYELSDVHKQILDERLAAHGSSPDSGSDWEEVKSRIKSKL